MALTEKQIKEFKETESEVFSKNFDEPDPISSQIEIAGEIAEAGDKEWAKKVYKKSEGKAEDSVDFRGLANSLCEKLGDKEWGKENL
jgi:hypothetical protein